MESALGRGLMLMALLFALVSCRVRGEEISNTSSIEARDKSVASSISDVKKGGGGGGGGGSGGAYGGGGCGWGYGSPGGSGGGGGGGGGSGYWKCQCTHSNKKGKQQTGEKREFGSEEYRTREFGECTARGKCRGMRLDCPLSCEGPCLYDCTLTCKAYCKS